MAMLRSVRQGDRALNWKDWAIATAVIWLAPIPLGIVVLALAYALSTLIGATSTLDATHPVLMLFLLGYALVFSPMFSWAGLAVALAPAWGLVRLGLGGWASFLVLGLMAGGLAGAMFQGFSSAIGAGFGAIAAMVFRWILSRLKREIFTPC